MNDVHRAAVVRAATLEARAWPPAVRALRALGFDAVDVPVVWREHARATDRLRFEGPLDLRAFLDVVAAEGMRAVVRLGPTSTAEAPALGVPDRVLRDARVHARTRRGNPMVTLDGLRLVPLPSLASRVWREEVARWLAAAVDALGDHVASGTVARVVVGPAGLRALRDSPTDRDHHPDIDGDGDDGAIERRVAGEYLRALVADVVSCGVPRERVVVAAPGHVLGHPATLDLAADHPVFVRAPTPRAGVEGVWRVARLAASLPRGAVVEVAAGTAPFQSPVRATHALQTARVAAAAGAATLTVAAGCAGHRWPGALLDERGEPRAHAAHWGRFLAASKAWPAMDPRTERAAVIPVDAERVARWRASPGLGALPRSPLVARGVHPATLAGDPEDRSFESERSLTRAGAPWSLALTPDALRPAGEGFAGASTSEGSALARAVEGDDGRWLLLVSASEATALVPLRGAWRDERGEAVDVAEVTEGDVRVLRGEAVT